MPKIHPHYVNTRFDSPHEDQSGRSSFYGLPDVGGVFMTPNECSEYASVGWLFDKVCFD